MPSTPDFSFPKAEHLKSRTLIGHLFDGKQRTVSQYPIRLVWTIEKLPATATHPTQAAFSVSKKKFKRAVDRNRIKRLLRESYRHHKQLLYEHLAAEGLQCALMFIYQSAEIADYATLEKSMQRLMGKWLREQTKTQM